MLPMDKYMVLIVDDVPANLAMLSDALDDSGHMVLVACDGASALERLDYVQPDIILMDAMMPGMDGFETCRRIKCLKSASAIPLVFMTGLTETEHVLQGFQAGGIDYVTKPIQPLEVIARIAIHVRQARLLAQARTALDAAQHAVIALGPARAVLWHTCKAARWIAQYFPLAEEVLPVLPAQLANWLSEQVPHAVTPATMTVERDGACLTLEWVAGEQVGESLLLLAERSVPGTSHPPQYGLTPRESEVLTWLVKGKTNRDIADIVGMSPRTVNKHLEHIFVKLGVETRSAAAALSVAWRHGMAA